MLHALEESEAHFGRRFDIILIVEPTSPLRLPEDLESCTRELISSGADSVVTVSPLDPKWHPHKVFTLGEDRRLEFFSPAGAKVVNRQELEGLFWRNGICYALTRACLKDKKRIITDNTRPWLIQREVINIDHPLELEWAEALLEKQERKAD
jgi:CMP-N-acetylneuraminic acid synthetase